MVVLINSCDIKHLFMCLLAIYICFLGEMSFQGLCQFLNCIVCLLAVDFYDISTYSGYWIFVRTVACQYFLPLCGWSFHHFDSVL